MRARGKDRLRTAALKLILLLSAIAPVLETSAAVQYSFDASGNLVVRAAAVAGPPQIIGQPVGVVASPGENASFSVIVANTSGVTFQWMFNGADISGATGDSLVLTNVSAPNEGQYSVRITNGAGNVTSTGAPLVLDGDGDGLSDAWELIYFGNVDQNPTGDFDGDGISNLDEFLEGTNPTDNTSFRTRLNFTSQGPGSFQISPFHLNYAQNESVTLTAYPDRADYPAAFLGWSGDLTGRVNPSVLAMNTSKTVVARFANPAILAPGMVAYYRGESDASDSVGNNNGTFYNGPNVTPPTIASGFVGNALSFDGTVNVHIPYAAELEPTQITIDAWVYPTVENGGVHRIVTRPRGGDNPSWALGLNNGLLYFWTYQGATGSNSHIPLNRWTHVAAVCDGATKFLYVNGVLDAQSAIGDGLLKYDQPGPVTLGDNFQGQVDELSVYNRALTPADLAGIATANSAGKDLTRPYFTSSSQFPSAYLGLNYTCQVTTKFGVNPITFSAPDGGLPPGLVFSSAGLLSGSPSAAGNFSFTLLATEALGHFTDQFFTLQVIGPLGSPAGLVAWWRAENNAADAAGTNNGSLTNGAGFDSGKVGQAFSLNGANQSVEIPDAPALRPASITLDAWVLFNSGANTQGIFSKRFTSINDSSYKLYLSNGVLYAGVGDSSGTAQVFLQPFTPTAGRWYHVAFSFDNTSKQLILYLDGAQVATGSRNMIIGYDSNPVSLGRDGANYLNGRIDEATIYKRALTAAEVASIYNAGPLGKRPLTAFEQWKLAYLGDFTAPDTGDPDGDGQSNLFEYVAGLIPTDPASRFQFRLEAIPNQPAQKNVIFSPLVAGRTYSVESTSNLTTPAWSALPQSSQIDNGNVRTVTDLAASPAPKYYRVQISYP